MDLEEAKRVHRRMVRKIGNGTYSREKHGALWDEAQAVIDREVYEPERQKAAQYEAERNRLFADPATGKVPY